MSRGDSGFFSFLKKAEGGLCHLWDRAVAAVKVGGADEGSGQNQGEPPSCPHELGITMVQERGHQADLLGAARV